MKKLMLNIILWTVSILLVPCSCKVKDRSDSNGMVADSSLISIQNKDTSKTDTSTLQKEELTKIYTQAISDYIKAVYQKDKIVFDTLFFGKRAFGQPDDFPDIALPETIEKTTIRLVNPVDGEKMQRERKSRVYINMIGWVDKETASFTLITFSNGFEHKFDCYIDYEFNKTQNKFELVKLRIETLIRDKEGNLERFAIYKDGKYVGDRPIKE
ncbi:MAG: hypothetical protein IPH31_14365 [Lewinellaceae bacterium]|nr:hypothetical protein [Lewinellaceae bacterium]